MPRAKPITRWASRDQMTAPRLNEMVDFLNSHSLAGNIGNYLTFANGTIIELPEPVDLTEAILAVIVAAGPDGAADFTGEQYWAQMQYILGDKFKYPINIKSIPNRFGGSNDQTNSIVPVTNLAERLLGGAAGLGTHSLPVGTPILMYAVIGTSDKPDTVGTSPTSPGSSPSPSVTWARTRYLTNTPTDGQPQYMGQARIAVAQNQKGWAFPFCHNLTS